MGVSLGVKLTRAFHGRAVGRAACGSQVKRVSFFQREIRRRRRKCLDATMGFAIYSFCILPYLDSFSIVTILALALALAFAFALAIRS
jgi:hypothetical protein